MENEAPIDSKENKLKNGKVSHWCIKHQSVTQGG